MADPEQFNADQLAFWNGLSGHTWVVRQAHTDITLAPALAPMGLFMGLCVVDGPIRSASFRLCTSCGMKFKPP